MTEQTGIKMKTCLVTGGAGFIGSHTCQSLLKRGCAVISVDNFNGYYDPMYKRDNIDEIVKTAGTKGFFKSLELDIRDRNGLEDVFREFKPDIVLHFAACAGVRPSIMDPLLYTSVNVDGTAQILECMKDHGVKHLVFASSSSVYGNNDKLPFSEADSVDMPISPYAATKKAGELICHTYSWLYGINTACLRFFTVYGPRQRPDLAIYKFTKLISEGKPVPVYGDGTSGRDYTYIDDIVDGINRAAAWTMEKSNRYGIFNLGGSRVITLAEMIEAIESGLGIRAVKEAMTSQPGDMVRTYADLSRSEKELGYRPGTGFESGIREFIKWYKKKRLCL